VTKMQKYEGAFILLSNLEEEVRKAELEKIKNIITERQGTIEKVNEWGQRRLAYEIEKKRDGYYVIINFTSNADAVNEIDRVCKISDNFIRLMITVDESK
jgi:small subunit ribosomal protein S6